jgi:hypothetical protein
MAVVVAGRTRRWTGALVATLGLVVAVDLFHTAGAWAGIEAPPASKLLSIGASAAGWVVAALAIRQLLRRRVESGLFQLLLAAGLLTVVGGLGDLGFLFRSQLASTLPEWTVRTAVTAKIGLGVGALVAASLHLRGMLGDPAVRDPAVDGRELPTGGSAVDNRAHPARRSARLPLRGPQQPEAGYLGAQQWAKGQRSAGGSRWAEEGQRWAQGWVDDPDGADLMDPDLMDPDLMDPDLMDPERPEPGRVPELHVVGGRTRRVARERAAVTSTSATVLPWPGPRHPSSHDPDLPGGA